MSDQPNEVVYETSDEIDADTCKALLESEGIQVSMMTSEALRSAYGLACPCQLIVPAGQAARARQLVADYEAQLASGAYALEEEDDNE